MLSLFFRYKTNKHTHYRYASTNYEKKEYPSIDEMSINPIEHYLYLDTFDFISVSMNFLANYKYVKNNRSQKYTFTDRLGNFVMSRGLVVRKYRNKLYERSFII